MQISLLKLRATELLSRIFLSDQNDFSVLIVVLIINQYHQ